MAHHRHTHGLEPPRSDSARSVRFGTRAPGSWNHTVRRKRLLGMECPMPGGAGQAATTRADSAQQPVDCLRSKVAVARPAPVPGGSEPWRGGRRVSRCSAPAPYQDPDRTRGQTRSPVKAHARLVTLRPCPLRSSSRGNTLAGRRRRQYLGKGGPRMACRRTDRVFTLATRDRSREEPECRAASSSAGSCSAPVASGRTLAGNARIRRSVDRRLRKNRKIRDLRTGTGASGIRIGCDPCRRR